MPLDHAPEGVDRTLHVADEQIGGAGRDDTLGNAFEEHLAERTLKIAHLVRDGRLRKLQTLCRLGEGTQTVDGHERPEPAQLHDHARRPPRLPC